MLLLSHWIPWTAACQASLSFAISQSLLKLKSTESEMLYSCFIALYICVWKRKLHVCKHSQLPLFQTDLFHQGKGVLCHKSQQGVHIAYRALGRWEGGRETQAGSTEGDKCRMTVCQKRMGTTWGKDEVAPQRKRQENKSKRGKQQKTWVRSVWGMDLAKGTLQWEFPSTPGSEQRDRPDGVGCVGDVKWTLNFLFPVPECSWWDCVFLMGLCYIHFHPCSKHHACLI